MARKKRKRKPIPMPVDRGRQPYRGLMIMELLKQSNPVYMTTEVISSRLPQWSTRAIHRDLKVLQALGWVACSRLHENSWRFVGITLPQKEESDGNDPSE